MGECEKERDESISVSLLDQTVLISRVFQVALL